MAQPAIPNIKVSELFQVGIVVRNLEKSMKYYETILGIGPWKLFDAGPDLISDTTYYGKPVQHTFKGALTMVGPMQLELIQPLEGESIYADFLREHGEGIHHLGHVIVKDLEEAVQKLEKAGFPCAQSGRHPGGAWAYMDTVKRLGYMIEMSNGPDLRDQFK